MDRRLPRTNTQRYMALMLCHLRLSGMALINSPITPATAERLNILFPEYDNRLINLANTFALLIASNAKIIKTRTRLKMFVSHYYEGLNNGIERGLFFAADRALYDLPVESNKLPNLVSIDNIEHFAKKIVEGEASRISKGGVTMGFPSAAEVEEILNEYSDLFSAKSIATDNYLDALRQVNLLNPKVNKLILRLWDEIETSLNHREKSAIRKIGRTWGIVYINQKIKKIRGTLKKKDERKMIYHINVAKYETLYLRNKGTHDLNFYILQNPDDALSGEILVVPGADIPVEIAKLGEGFVYLVVVNTEKGKVKYEVEVN